MAKSSLVPLSDYTEDFLVCRDLMHAWEIYAWYREDHETRRVLRCKRCDTERHDRWNPITGERIGASYVYEEGYQIPGGIERTAVRLATMQRAKVYASWDAAKAATTNGRKK